MRRSAFVTASSCGVSLLAISIACCASAQSLSERLQGVAEQKRSAAAHNTSKAAMLGALMYTDITCDFKATRAREAIDYVGNALGVSLVGRYSSDKAGNGIDPEAEITLKAERKPARLIGIGSVHHTGHARLTDSECGVRERRTEGVPSPRARPAAPPWRRRRSPYPKS